MRLFLRHQTQCADCLRCLFKEQSPRSVSPSRSPGKAETLDRAPTTSTCLVAALNEVHDVFSRPGLSQIPLEELADSTHVLDEANRRLQLALARNTSKNAVAVVHSAIPSWMDTMWFFDRQARRRSTRFIIGESSHKVSPLNLTIYIFF